MSETKTPYLGLRTALIVEDHEVYRSAIARIMQKNCGFTDVFEAASFTEAKEILQRSDQIALVVFGIDLTQGSSLADIRRLRKDRPDLVVVVMSGSEEREHILAVVAEGAHGYIPKSLPLAGVTAALVSVTSGTIYLPWSVSDLSPRRPVPPSRAEHRPKMKLTARQADVLRLIRARKSNREIALELGLTEGTVKVHANAVFRALGVTNRSGAASFEMD